jgi:hypothetical protein
VADSIVSASDGRVSAAAHGLPTVFDVESMTNDAMKGEGARCAQVLRDPRSGTRLIINQQLSNSEKTGRGDTVVLAHQAIGLYRVIGRPMYGTDSSSYLRVGCDDAMIVTVGGRPLGEQVTSLATSNDDRARSLARTISQLMSLRADSLELRRKRVHAVFSDLELQRLSDDARFGRSFEIARLVWREYGRAAGIDTVTIAVHGDGTPLNLSRRVVTASFYPEQLNEGR